MSNPTCNSCGWTIRNDMARNPMDQNPHDERLYRCVVCDPHATNELRDRRIYGAAK